jgi:hypothetical protein
MPLSESPKDGVSIYHVESGAGKLSKLPLNASGILGLRYCATEQT